MTRGVCCAGVTGCHGVGTVSYADRVVDVDVDVDDDQYCLEVVVCFGWRLETDSDGGDGVWY